MRTTKVIFLLMFQMAQMLVLSKPSLKPKSTVSSSKSELPSRQDKQRKERYLAQAVDALSSSDEMVCFMCL
ncbi:hypothetical protein SeMB42_g00721 [Synchytrium endobioticum]|uniref:Uncharacterized protein n=1 Tax=Synchytrium endobioticum TaxID=286115 RepID=A0A507DPM2_9FUNG|nr:hypothetical protein SeMB42_g00721 [Synchytrium endobioticum]